MKKLLTIIILATLIMPFFITPISFAYDNMVLMNEQNKENRGNIIEEDKESSNKEENNTKEEEKDNEIEEIENNTNEEEKENEIEDTNKEEDKNIENSVSESSKEDENSEEDKIIKEEEQEENKIETKKEKKSTEIEEGIYYIKTSIDEKRVLDVKDNSKENGANIQLWEKSAESTDNQKFEITKTESGNYRIKAMHSGKVLEEKETKVQQNEINNKETQEWIISETEEGYYNIISKSTGLYLDIPGALATNGRIVSLYEENETNAQKFKLEEIEELTGEKTIEEGTYYIKSAVNTKKVFDVTGNSSSNGANIQLWEKSAESTDNQKFEVKYLSNGYYEIKAKHSGKVLDVAGAGTTNGTRIQQYDSNGSDAQKWIIKEAGGGYYYLISKCNGLYIDIPGGIVTDGSSVQMYEGNGSTAQKFEFEKIEELIGKKTIEEGKYKIKAGTNEKLGFDVESNSKESGANVQIWKESELISKNQRFEIEYNEEGYYTIEATHSKKVLEAIDGTNLKQNDANGEKSQQWIIEVNDDGTYSIISRLNGLYITMDSVAEGSKIKLSKGNGSQNQKFKFQKLEQEKSERLIEDGVYTIRSALNTKEVFDIAEASYKDGANLQLWTSTGVQQQKFEVKYLSEGYYEIKSANSGKMLDVAGGNDENGTNVRQYKSNGTEYQKWIIQDAGNGYFYIISRGAESYLDVAGDVGREGANIQIYEADGTAAQKFKFEKTPIIEGNKNYNISIAISETKVLDIDLPTSNLQIWELNTQSNNQKFKLEYIEKGYYKIICKASNEVLTVNDGNNIIQSEYAGNDNQKWIIEVAQNGYYYIKSKGTGLYLDVTGASSADGTRMRVSEKKETSSQMFKFNEASNSNESNFLDLDESKYPGYKEALQKLQEQHPNWTIRIDYTGLEWNEVLDAEHSLTDKGSARSLTQATGDWRDSTDTKEYEPGWYRASKEAIAYMMDPRNSFDDEYIFQFQELATSTGAYSDIANMIQGTYLTKYEGKLAGTTTDSIINTILASAQQYNISPYHLASRMIYEQGTNGTPLSDGYVCNGTPVYNLFNIQATGSTNEEIWKNGAVYAYNHHWFSPELCIKGSAEFLARDYISIGQSTLYYQRYDVVGDELYTHQYMTNIRGANDEGQEMGKEYKENGLIDLPFEFTIPVYENMPIEKAPRPSTN